MKWKEFYDWVSNRTCDGCWGMQTAMFCISVIEDVQSKPFWKRQKYWTEKYEQYVVGNIVDPINEKMKEVFGGDPE